MKSHGLFFLIWDNITSTPFFRAFFLVLFLTLFIGCSEETIEATGRGAVKGVVVRKGTNTPLKQVKIATNPNSSTVFSGDDGSYHITNIPAGQYTLSAQLEGLLAEFESITILEDQTIEQVFELDVETATNKPPTIPKLESPADLDRNQKTTLTLTWSGTDPDSDELSYSVLIRNNKNENILEYNEISEQSLDLKNLEFSTTYFWQVTVSDGINSKVNSTNSAFTTEQAPNHRLLFTRLVGTNSVIFSADENGENSIQLTADNQNCFRPRKNTDTNRIAFLQTVGSQTHLFVMHSDGTNQRQLTRELGVTGFLLSEIDFSWENRGASLLFPNQNTLYRIQVDGSGLTPVYQVDNNRLITEVATQHASQSIALKTNTSSGYDAEIILIHSDGSLQRTIVSGQKGALGGLDFSVDGQKILYTQDVSGFENTGYRRLDSRIILYNLGTNTAVDISEEKPQGTNDLDPRFSPNEATIIYVNSSNDGFSDTKVQKMEIDGDVRTDVLDNAAMPDWE